MQKSFSCLTLFFYTVFALFGLNSQVARAQAGLGKSYFENLQRQVQTSVQALYPELEINTQVIGDLLQVSVTDADGNSKQAEIDFNSDSLGITVANVPLPSAIFHTAAAKLHTLFSNRLSEGLGSLVLDPQFKSTLMNLAIEVLPSLVASNTPVVKKTSGTFFSWVKHIFYSEAFADPISLGIVVILVALAAIIISTTLYTLIHCHSVLKENKDAEEMQFCRKYLAASECDYCQ